jgi:hypothetical protein
MYTGVVVLVTSVKLVSVKLVVDVPTSTTKVQAPVVASAASKSCMGAVQ